MLKTRAPVEKANENRQGRERGGRASPPCFKNKSAVAAPVPEW